MTKAFVVGSLSCDRAFKKVAVQLTVLIGGRSRRYCDVFDCPVRLPDPGRCRDIGIVSSIGCRMDQGFEGSSDAVSNEPATVYGADAGIYNNLGHLPDFIPRNEDELIRA